MRNDNPFWQRRISKTSPSEVLDSIEELANPVERAVWALEMPYLLPQNYAETVPEGLFDSLVKGDALIDIPHCQALSAFFQGDFKKAKEIAESAPEDPYTTYNFMLTLEALGEREIPFAFWQAKLNDDLTWTERLAIYEHLRTNWAAHEIVCQDIEARFESSEPKVMLQFLSHLVMHKDFDLAENLWVKGAILYEELEDFGVNLALSAGKLPLAISRLRNLGDNPEKETFVADFLKIVALKALEDNDFASALELVETLLAEFKLDDAENLLYLRIKCACSLQVLHKEISLEALTDEEKEQLNTGLAEILIELEKETKIIKSLATSLKEAEKGPEDDYLLFLQNLINKLKK